MRRWTAEVIRPLGLELTGPFCQYNASPSFSLIRFETTGPAVWFKAVGEPNQREFPITLKLSQQFPKYLPEILGTRADRNGWLSLEAPGANLCETQEIMLWESAAESLARLQIESVAKTESILDAGAHDLRIETLSGLSDPISCGYRATDGAADQSSASSAEPAGTEPVGCANRGFAHASRRPWNSRSALGHLDLNPGTHCVRSIDAYSSTGRKLMWAIHS